MQYLRKLSVYIILTGMLLVLASCVPVLGTLYRLLNPEHGSEIKLSLNDVTRTIIEVEGQERGMLTLLVEPAKKDVSLSGVRYRYEIIGGNNALQQAEGTLESNSEDEMQSNAHPEAAEGRVLAFPIFELAVDQKTIELEMQLLGDGLEADDVTARARVMLIKPQLGISFINALIIWMLGSLLVLVGATSWARNVAALPVDQALITNEQSSSMWCMWCHLSALAGYLVPFGHILVPLVIWSAQRRRIYGVDDAGRESLNFQLTVTLLAFIGLLLSILFVGLVFIVLLLVFHFSLTIIAAFRARRGDIVRYPLCFRIIT